MTIVLYLNELDEAKIKAMIIGCLIYLAGCAIMLFIGWWEDHD